MRPLDLSDNAVWKQRFRAPRIASFQLAEHDHTRGLVVSNQSGIYQLYAWDVPSGALRQLTDVPHGVVFGAISPDGRWIYALQDAGGDEIGHYVRIPFAGGADPQDITPLLPEYASWSIGENHAGGMLAFSAANESGFQLFVQDIGAAQGDSLPIPHLRYQTEALMFSGGLSYHGEIVLVATTERTGKNEFSLRAVDTRTGAVLNELWDGEGTTLLPYGFAPTAGDFRVLATSSRTGFARPLLWDVRTGTRHDLPLADIEGEVTIFDWSVDGRILLNVVHQAVDHLYVYDLNAETLTALPAADGTQQNILHGTCVKEEIVALISSADQPPHTAALDATTGAFKRVILSAGDSPAGRAWRSVQFPSRDGTLIQGWLAVPEGAAPFPTILETHGGPTDVQDAAFHPTAQAWLDHGFAFLTINYRGSTTFGADFERAIWGRLGVLEVEDMAAARAWLVENGVAQADSILLTGGSYGGYLTLQALGREPTLWAGGMAQVAIADWRLMYEDQAETLRGYQRALFGGTPDETPEATRTASPITYAKELIAPLLVIQGENDTRCPARQMRAYEDTLRAYGKDITVHWFDAGHGSRAMEQQIDHMELMLRFAYRVLG